MKWKDGKDREDVINKAYDNINILMYKGTYIALVIHMKEVGDVTV